MSQAKQKKAKVGRPKLPKGHAKGMTVQVRLKPDDAKRMRARANASKQTLSEWVRSTLNAAVAK